MAPPVFLTTGREAPPPPSPSTARAYEQWLAETFDEALFVTQQDRALRFVRTARQAGSGVALILAKSREPTAADEVSVPVAALGDTSVSPCIAKVYLFLFNATLQGTHGEVTARRSKAEGASVAKIIVTRSPVAGSGTTRATQSTLTLNSFLSLQVSHNLTRTQLALQGGAGSGGTPTAHPADTLSWAAFPQLEDLARAADVFESAEPKLSWGAAEEFLSAALTRTKFQKPSRRSKRSTPRDTRSVRRTLHRFGRQRLLQRFSHIIGPARDVTSPYFPHGRGCGAE